MGRSFVLEREHSDITTVSFEGSYEAPKRHHVRFSSLTGADHRDETILVVDNILLPLDVMPLTSDKR